MVTQVQEKIVGHAGIESCINDLKIKFKYQYFLEYNKAYYINFYFFSLSELFFFYNNHFLIHF